MSRKLKILVIFDFPLTPPDEHYEKYVEADDWRPNRNVIETLTQLGHEVDTFPIHNNLAALIDKISTVAPDIVFNLAECFDSDRRHESSIVGLLEMMNIPFTGSPSLVLGLCQNKFFTKRLLSQHKIKMPRSVLFPLGQSNRSLSQLRYPVFVKPLCLEGSDGIVQNSFADSQAACIERVKFLHESLKVDALVEEYIEGRELYSGVLGNDRLKVLPLREMIFENFPEERPKFATFKAKWDEDFRKKWGIRNTFAQKLDEAAEAKIRRISRSAYRALGLRGYGRLDFRLTPEGDLYLLEVNPNPNLSKDDEIAYSAARLGITYRKLIARVLELGLKASSLRHAV